MSFHIINYMVVWFHNDWSDVHLEGCHQHVETHLAPLRIWLARYPNICTWRIIIHGL